MQTRPRACRLIPIRASLAVKRGLARPGRWNFDFGELVLLMGAPAWLFKRHRSRQLCETGINKTGQG